MLLTLSRKHLPPLWSSLIRFLMCNSLWKPMLWTMFSLQIFSIVNEDDEVHLVTFHSCTFTVAELNYDIHNKELLAIFKAFKIWWHYLEGLVYPIDIATDHKNLEYFFTTKILTWRQAWWSKYLSQFNLVIRFCSGYLGTKPDTFTRWWDIYPKGRNTGYATVNLHNFKPIFTQE